MNVLIVGGGKVGYYLASHLSDSGHRVTLIEKDPERSRKISDVLNVLVICGEGSELGVLEDAEAANADVVAVVTGRDEDNLVVAQVLKEYFAVQRIVVRVNNPANEPVFHALGFDLTVSSTGVISRLIEEETAPGSLNTLLTFHKGEMLLTECIVSASSPIVGLSVQEIVKGLSDHIVFVAVIRTDDVIIPRGDTVIEAGDKLLILTSIRTKDEVERLVRG